MVREDMHFFTTPRSLALEVPTIRIDSEATDGGIQLTLETDVLAKGVFLRAEGARFSRNFFDLLPGRPTTVIVTTEVAAEAFEGQLSVRTLAEVPREGTRVEEIPGR